MCYFVVLNPVELFMHYVVRFNLRCKLMIRKRTATPHVLVINDRLTNAAIKQKEKHYRPLAALWLSNRISALFFSQGDVIFAVPACFVFAHVREH